MRAEGTDRERRERERGRVCVSHMQCFVSCFVAVVAAVIAAVEGLHRINVVLQHVEA